MARRAFSHRNRRHGAMVVLAAAALLLGLSTAGAQTTSPPLTIGLSPDSAPAGTTVAVTVAGDECASGTTGVLKVDTGAPDPPVEEPVMATVNFADANHGSFVVVDMPADFAGTGTEVVVECLDADGTPRTGRAPFTVEAPVNAFIIVKDVTDQGGSTQVFEFVLDAPPGPSPGPVFALSDGGSEPDTFSAYQIATGRYTFTERPTDGWTLTGITCDEPAAVVDLAAASVSFELDESTILTCTFQNTSTPQPSIVAVPPIAAAASFTG